MNEQAPQTEAEQPAKRSGGGCARCAIGCGIFILILVLVLAVAAWFLWRPVVAWAVSFSTQQAVEASGMPDDQKQAITSRIDKFTQAFSEGNVTLEEFGKAFENLDVENLLAAGMTQFVGAGMIDSSQLSD